MLGHFLINIPCSELHIQLLYEASLSLKSASILKQESNKSFGLQYIILAPQKAPFSYFGLYQFLQLSYSLG